MKAELDGQKTNLMPLNKSNKPDKNVQTFLQK